MIEKKDNYLKIVEFIKQHHVLNLATSQNIHKLSVCSLFYTFLEDKAVFIVASNEETTHIQDALLNPSVAGTIVLETKTVGQIEGLQFRGKLGILEDSMFCKYYFKDYPYAVAMRPKLWQIMVDSFKYTDNKLGFGKKIFWESRCTH